MKVSKQIMIAALVAGNLLAWNPALRAGDTNTPPAKPPAGSPPPDQRPPRGGFDRMFEQLNLTADQKPKVQALMEAQRQKGQELRQNTSLSQEEKQAKRKAIHDETVTQMKAILTPEQFEKWQKPQMMHGPGNGPKPGGEKTEGTNAPAAPPKND
jgi:Spy/CpxP family protein refolding chaperone